MARDGWVILVSRTCRCISGCLEEVFCKIFTRYLGEDGNPILRSTFIGEAGEKPTRLDINWAYQEINHNQPLVGGFNFIQILCLEKPLFFCGRCTRFWTFFGKWDRNHQLVLCKLRLQVKLCDFSQPTTPPPNIPPPQVTLPETNVAPENMPSQ